jgi:hypothetical protein
VSQNVIIGGSTHIDGELFVNHVTAPAEVQETEQVDLYGETVTGVIIGYATGTDSGGDSHTLTVYGLAGGATQGSITGGTNQLRNYHHSHQFKNLPLHLVNSSQDVRKLSQRIENPERDGAAAPENVNKGIGLTNTGEKIGDVWGGSSGGD